MNLRQLLEDPEIQLPIQQTEDDFQVFVAKKLATYLNLLDRLTEPKDFADQVHANMASSVAFADASKRAIESFFSGYPAEAYCRFVEALSHIEGHLHKQAIKDLEDLGFLYRVRKKVAPPLTRKELFHIPFDSRHLVATQRYSIPGLPCLYLGGSLYTCWAEMGKPPFHELQVAAFWLTPGRKVQILNLSNRPKRLLYYIPPDGRLPSEPENAEMILTYLLLWPLMALTSIVVKHRDGSFKPEYIVPQLLLQWITKEHNYDGICYFSTHVPAATTVPLPTCNVIFPVRQLAPRGHCPKLRDMFRMTEPHGWEFLRAINTGGSTPSGVIPGFEFEFIDGHKESYRDTEFGHVQTKINKLALEIQHRNRNGFPDDGIVPK